MARTLRVAVALSSLALLSPLFLGGCAPVPPPSPAALEECGRDGIGHQFLGSTPAIPRQGTTLKLTPMQDRSPFGTREIAVQCTSKWTVSHPRLAKLSKDRRSLVISRDAPPGTLITVSYVNGDLPVRAEYKVVAADAVVLTGRRGQRSVENCELAEPVGELVFTGAGRFSVTFRPFENYYDYGGSYSFDAETGRLSMNAENGNYIPPGLDLEGSARLEPDGRLILNGFYLGQTRLSLSPGGGQVGDPACRYTF